MSTKLKLYLGRKVIDCLHKYTKFSLAELQPLIQIGNADESKISMSLPLNDLERQLGVTNITEVLKIQPDDIIKNIYLVRDRANRRISFEIDKTIFIKDVIENCAFPELNFSPKNIVVDFSSPNVAKPFHLGHLRSTIIGNFISNLNSFLRHKVVRLNYVGNWGTQFGLIKVGIEELKYTPEDIKKDPLTLLYKSYVHANKLAEKDSSILNRAKQEFLKLEIGSVDDIKDWQTYMDYSKKELINTYNRLGISFDDYSYESDYSAKNIGNVIEMLRTKNIIQKSNDGKEVATIHEKKVSVLKSDGSTLYLTRDIAAAIDRFKKYSFDKMYYVVDNSQSDHLYTLKDILYKMDLPWAGRLVHVKFGRIRGMSTRKGTSIFLKDILDECRDIMIKRQVESPTTKVPINDGEVADILGVSCVIINELKRRRQKDYEFNWDTVLQVQGDTGIRLQYTHCRLHSLEKNSGATPAKECNPEIFDDPEALVLLKVLAKFHDVLYKANAQLEAYILVNYLFHLCNYINKALHELQVKGMSPDVASQRLLLFNTAREVLKNGMEILGLQPLQAM
uniref:Probable arginine--tRNA ligase, mitochondrial n=1 Tax=Caryedes brasiliensis TaxID=1443082 RepID=W0G1S3_9CUCU|nr:mitochondrial arginyl-tRNA synthetase [Caryedes brasiliensis]